jgi:hypothetical protein
LPDTHPDTDEVVGCMYVGSLALCEDRLVIVAEEDRRRPLRGGRLDLVSTARDCWTIDFKRWYSKSRAVRTSLVGDDIREGDEG